MYKRLFRGFVIAAAVILTSAAVASEPDGRVAFRYEWIDNPDGGPGSQVLRLTVTAFVSLSDAQLLATLPSGTGLSVRAAGVAPAPWPEDGLALGKLDAGQTIVVEFEVAKPAKGGGIAGFALSGTFQGGPVREGVGVPIGLPGLEPTLRNGAVEYPAARADPAP